MISKSKTTCFTMLQKLYVMVKDSILKGKTSCFTVSDSSDRYSTTITQYNKLILNRLDTKVIDN